MANQDILYELWKTSNMPRDKVTIEEIGEFAENKKNSFRSKRGRITYSGFDYAVLKFILQYCSPLDWPESYESDFEKAKNPYGGNYGIWRQYPELRVKVKEETSSRIYRFRGRSISSSVSPVEPSVQHMVSTDSLVDGDMCVFVDFVVRKIDEQLFLGEKGWLDQLTSYQWPPEKGIFTSGISIRKNFHDIVNCAAQCSSPGSEYIKQGVCNAVARWSGISKEVSLQDSIEIFESIQYLKRATGQDRISCERIFNRRIATVSKMYYFSDPWNWTIYDSRVAYALSQFAYLLSQEEREVFDTLRDRISFPIPLGRKARPNPFCAKYYEADSALWFVRASTFLKAITTRLNRKGIEFPPDHIRPSDRWELYHVEMVFFRLGKEQFL